MRFLSTIGGGLVVLGMLAGCSFLGNGARNPTGPEKSTVAYQTESEWIPQATLVTQDIEPDWRMGRHTFQAGGNDLLVLTRITSWDETASTEARKSGVGLNRQERAQERLWIMIPQSAQVNEDLDLYTLARGSLVGYDQNVAAMGFFVKPFQIHGKLRILARTEREAVVDLRMKAEPDDMPEWAWRAQLTVPVTPDGRRAERLAPNAPVLRIARDRGSEIKDWTGVMDVLPAREQAALSAEHSESPRPESAKVTPPVAAPTTVIGAWVSAIGEFKFAGKFGNDGTFVFTTTKSDGTSSVQAGQFQVRADRLTLTIERWVAGPRDLMPMLSARHYAVLKMSWEGERLVLDGDFHDLLTRRRRVFQRADESQK